MPTFNIFGNHERYQRALAWDWQKLLSECILQENYITKCSKAIPVYQWEASSLGQEHLAKLEDEVADAKYLLELMVAHLKLIVPRDARMILKLRVEDTKAHETSDRFFAWHKFDF